MRTLLIYPASISDYSNKPFYIPAIALLSGIIRNAGHPTKFLQFLTSDFEARFSGAIHEFNPDIIMISINVEQVKNAKEILSFLNMNYPEIKVLIGGPQSTIAPEEFLREFKNIYAVVIGFCESIINDLLYSISIKEYYLPINNVWYNSKEGTLKNNIIYSEFEDKPWLPDLEVFREQIEMIGEKEFAKTICFVGSRGCPFTCTYCFESGYAKVFNSKNRITKYKKVDNLILEILHLRKQLNFEYVNFYDNIFGLNKVWLREFMEKYTKHIGLPYMCFNHFDCLDDEKINLLKESNCDTMVLGLESGSESLRKSILNRHITNSRIREVGSKIRQAGIKLITFNMIGLPYETEDDIIQTIKLNHDLKAYPWIYIYQPYKYTTLFDTCNEQGLLYYEETEELFKIRNPTISEDKVKLYFSLFRELVKTPDAVSLVKIRTNECHQKRQEKIVGNDILPVS